ncbi:MAG: amidohydrolase family protein, partial [bacterium]
LAKGKPHPRIFGTFPRVIRKYVREEKLLDLGRAIHKMTWQPAERFKIDKRGKIAEGFFADLVLFDFDKISDRSDFLDPFHYAEGIEAVWVNGILAVDRGKLTPARGGHVLRKGVDPKESS